MIAHPPSKQSRWDGAQQDGGTVLNQGVSETEGESFDGQFQFHWIRLKSTSNRLVEATGD